MVSDRFQRDANWYVLKEKKQRKTNHISGDITLTILVVEQMNNEWLE